MAKEGSTISGFADSVRAGDFLRVAVRRSAAGAGRQVQPRAIRAVGNDRNPEIRFAKSIVDYIFRWLASKFLSAEAQFHAGVERTRAGRNERPRAVNGDSATGRRAGAPDAEAGGGDDAVLDDSKPGRRAALLDVRIDHDPQWSMLQVRQLRQYERVRLRAARSLVSELRTGATGRPEG